MNDADDIPESFICPILRDVMVDPVSTADGHSYERSAIVQWLDRSTTSPATGAQLIHTSVTNNHNLRKSIDEWRQQRFNMIRACDLEVFGTAIAAGSFKSVFRGRLKRAPGTTALLKEPSTVAVMMLRDGGELETEAKILLKLGHHPRLLRYIGMCTERQPCCLVTEFASMGSVKDALTNIALQLTPAHDLAMLQQICSGMEMLASEHLVHRDLALRNVLLFAFDRENVGVTSVKVSDFGLTVNTGGATHMTVSAGAKPVRWMAPEALRHGRYSEKSDVWAFGVTSLELLSRGELPYFDLTEDDRVAAHVVRGRGKPRRPPECVHGTYDRLWRCVDACWGYDAISRPSFAQLCVTLGQLPIPDPSSTDSTQALAAQFQRVMDVPTESVSQFFVLRSTGQLVTKDWLFENGYRKADCETVPQAATNKRRMLQASVDTCAKSCAAIAEAIARVEHAVTSVEAREASVIESIDASLDAFLHNLTHGVNRRRTQLHDQVRSVAHEHKQALSEQLTSLRDKHAGHRAMCANLSAAVDLVDVEVIQQADEINRENSAGEIPDPSGLQPVVGSLVQCVIPSGDALFDQVEEGITQIGIVQVPPVPAETMLVRRESSGRQNDGAGWVPPATIPTYMAQSTQRPPLIPFVGRDLQNPINAGCDPPAFNYQDTVVPGRNERATTGAVAAPPAGRLTVAARRRGRRVPVAVVGDTDIPPFV
eukprot:m.1108009 g.1108009  ORF g.1108009 m.1108009 type:complete len:710 (-) comp24351_c0_seq3:2151-4280(-)